MKLRTTVFAAILLFVFTVCANAQANNSSNSSENKKREDKPLKIKKHPQVQYRQEDCNVSKTSVNLKVTFDKSGEITKADIIKSSGCGKFDEQALSAARKIKFTPAMKNGEPITVVKMVQYTFEIF